jgi:hypothetical protein
MLYKLKQKKEKTKINPPYGLILFRIGSPADLFCVLPNPAGQKEGQSRQTLELSVFFFRKVYVFVTGGWMDEFFIAGRRRLR